MSDINYYGNLDVGSTEKISDNSLPGKLEETLKIYNSYLDVTGKADFVYSDKFRGLISGLSRLRSERALDKLEQLLEIQMLHMMETNFQNYQDGLEQYLQYEDQYYFEKQKHEEERKNRDIVLRKLNPNFRGWGK